MTEMPQPDHAYATASALAPVAGTRPSSLPPAQTGIGSSTARRARLQIFPSPGPNNALWYFPQVTGGYGTVLRNALLLQIARYTPFLALKNQIYRMLGVRVGKNVSVGLMVMLDIFFPQDITLGDHCLIGYNSVLLCHEFLHSEWRRGPIWIGQRVMIGANTTILPGVIIGDGAIVSAMSLVNRDVYPGTMVGGVPIQVIRPAHAVHAQEPQG